MSPTVPTFAVLAALVAFGWLRTGPLKPASPTAVAGISFLTLVLSFAIAWRTRSDTWQQFVMSAATVTLILVATFDVKTKRLPDVFTIPAVVLSTAAVVASGHNVRQALVCGVVALGLFGLLWLAGRGKGLGLGDVKLAPTLGLLAGWFSWTVALAALYLSVFTAALYAVAILASKTRRSHTREFAYGPFMVAGLLIAVLLLA